VSSFKQVLWDDLASRTIIFLIGMEFQLDLCASHGALIHKLCCRVCLNHLFLLFSCRIYTVSNPKKLKLPYTITNPKCFFLKLYDSSLLCSIFCWKLVAAHEPTAAPAASPLLRLCARLFGKCCESYITAVECFATKCENKNGWKLA
jgi:hypothetical protein